MSHGLCVLLNFVCFGEGVGVRLNDDSFSCRIIKRVTKDVMITVDHVDVSSCGISLWGLVFPISSLKG